MEPPLDQARIYLDGNVGLREALGIDASAELEAHPLGAGEHNANFWFAHPETGERYVLRINYFTQVNAKNQIAYEYNALTVLEPCGRTPRPFFLDDSKARIDHGVLVEGYVEGRDLDFELPGDLEQAAAILADIHSLKPTPDCSILQPGDPLQAQFEECERMYAVYDAHPGLQDPLIVSYATEFIERTRRALAAARPARDRSHIVNTEAINDHFRISEKGGKSHMIDWEKPILAEVAQDLAYFLSPTTTIWNSTSILDRQAREKFLDDYWRAVDGRFPQGDFEERFGLYVMSNALRGVTWCCKAVVDYADPAAEHLTDETPKRLGRYLNEEFLQTCKELCFS